MFPLEQGAFEMVLIGVFALIVVGPKDLPVLMRRVGQAMAKMRGLAAEFRASFDEMARQSELEDLRKEVEALRTGAMDPINTLHSDLTGGLNDLNASAAVESQGFAFPPSPLAYEPPVYDTLVAEAAEADAAAQSEAKPKRVRKPKPTPDAAPDGVEVAAASSSTPKPRRARVKAAPVAEAGGGRLSADDTEIEASRAPLLEHLAELRTRLIICIAAIAVGFVLSFSFAQDIYVFLVRPFEMASAISSQKGPHNPFELVLAVSGFTHPVALHPATLQATGPLEIFFTKMKLAMFAAIMITFPVLAWQLYRFVAPGLYKRERKAFLPFLLASPVLFALGASLVYFVMLPFVMWFSLSQQVQSAAVNIVLIPKVSDYLDLVMKLLLAFGLCFQLPVILSLAGLAGLVQSSLLAKSRRYAIVGIVVVSAMVTPPDMISPFLLALPIYALYEGSILCVRLIELRRKREDALLTAA